MHPGVGSGLSRDGEALPLPQHRGRRVGHNVAADVDWVPLPGVVDGVVGQELGDVCEGGPVQSAAAKWQEFLKALEGMLVQSGHT